MKSASSHAIPSIVPHPRATHAHVHTHDAAHASAHAHAHAHAHAAPPLGERRRQVRVARLVFVTFIFTFVIARIVVFLIMSGILPDIFMRYGETHVHHLNY